MTVPSCGIDAAMAERFARLALNCVDREYPSHILHLMTGPNDARTPRELTPAFFGCFDWHSAVHGHWTLVRLLRFYPVANWSAAAQDVLDRHLSPDCIAGERKYIGHPERVGFERPYGLAWLLQLALECRELAGTGPEHLRTQHAAGWADALAPLADLAADRLCDWLPKLLRPIRSGEHSQTAFALGLAYDWAVFTSDPRAETIRSQALRLFRSDTPAPVGWEPGGHDFVSPVLGEADLLRRFLSPADFSDWLGRFLPGLTADAKAFPLQPVTPADRSDGKIAHLDGLNLSRAWMFQGIAAALQMNDARVPALQDLAESHASAGLKSVTGEHYAGGHWLGTFAVYLLTGRGLSNG